MYTVKMKGKTAEEAIKSALQVLNISRESAEIKIIDEGETGMLGVFGGRDAEVEVRAKAGVEEKAKTALQNCLDKMGFIAQAYVVDNNAEYVSLEIKGDDISMIIGRDGTTLDSLQTLVNVIANKNSESRKRILIDAGDYRKKQEKRVEKIAQECAEEALVAGKDIELPPMNARERRIVHLTIKAMGNVTSQSTGERNDRRVIISPKK